MADSVDLAITTIEHLFSTLVRPGAPDAVVLLGAGASLKSGIPLSAQIVEIAAKWAYCRNHGRDPDDPTVVRSDWLPWLHAQPWYRIDQSPADNYSDVVEHLLQPREERRQFYLRIINPGVPPSAGYERMVDLLAHHVIRTVLTTNFDAVLADLCRARHRPHHVEVIKTPADYTKLSTFPPHSQLVYLHGSVEHYTDKNLLQEVQRLDEDLVRQLVPLLRDHPLVVIGYRGGEPSVMRHLLMEQAVAANYFRHGIFWCAMRDSVPAKLHPLVHDLADTIGGNFQVVPMDGFDELLGQLWTLYEQRPHAATPVVAAPQGTTGPSAPTVDMRLVAGSSLDELDWAHVQTHVLAYCRRMAIAVPVPVERPWLVDRLCDLDLAVCQDGTVRLTTAGYLLFAKHPCGRVKAAQVVLRGGNEPVRTFEGHLWSQLEGITDALEEVNRPFQLKGPVSEAVFPYPPLALKEVVVNALVHRSYDDAQRVVVEVEPTHIRVTNPGGLVEQVLRRVDSSLQEQLERGGRGIKGYRNPVIADLFYGAGAMDKAGSGLADVQAWVKQNGGKVRFGPTANNEAFDVTIYRRPETVDPVTGTATPLSVTARYVSNLLEVVALPPTVWHAGTSAGSAKAVWQGSGAEWLPPFLVHQGRVFSFADLTDPANPLVSQIDPYDVEDLSLGEFADGEDGERGLVYLLHQCLYRRLEARGLIVDRKRKRAYFPRTDQGPREVTYQARIRRATRTVTKPIVARTTQRVRYWEHEGIRFGFERFGAAWALHILPCYVFTVDGERRLLEGSRVGALATRRAARDYNPQVHNDLVFWAWLLSDGQDSIILDAGCGSEVQLRAALTACEVRDVRPLPDVMGPELDPRLRAELDELELELAKLAEAERARECEETDGGED
jgi:hypothetical protein